MPQLGKQVPKYEKLFVLQFPELAPDKKLERLRLETRHAVQGRHPLRPLQHYTSGVSNSYSTAGVYIAELFLCACVQKDEEGGGAE